MMRAAKTATNAFLYAKCTLRPLSEEDDENTKPAAELLMIVYHACVSINTRMTELCEKMDNLEPDSIDRIYMLRV